MSTPKDDSWSRVGNLVLRHAFDVSSTSVRLEPRGAGYVVTTKTGEAVEQIMAPSAELSLGLFVHYCRRAGISKTNSSGSFAFEHQGHSHNVEMHIVARPEGNGALLLLH